MKKNFTICYEMIYDFLVRILIFRYYKNMKRILILFALISVFSLSAVFAQESSEPGSDSQEAFSFIPNLEPEESKDIDISSTKVIFKTNVKSAKIYLNQNFQGVTKLTLNNLIEGFYLLRAVKEGYKYQEYFVYIERGKQRTYYVELEPEEKAKESEVSEPEAQTGAEPETGAQESAGTQNESAGIGEN